MKEGLRPIFCDVSAPDMKKAAALVRDAARFEGFESLKD